MRYCMFLSALALVSCISIGGCMTSGGTTTDPNTGKVTTDPNVPPELNVDATCRIIKSVVQIGLPLAIEKSGQEDRQIQRLAAVVKSLEAITVYLGDGNTEVTEKAVNDMLDAFGKKLSPFEKSAIQGGINLVMGFLESNVDPKGVVNPKVVQILKCFFSEVSSVFKGYVEGKTGVPGPATNLILRPK